LHRAVDVYMRTTGRMLNPGKYVSLPPNWMNLRGLAAGGGWPTPGRSAAVLFPDNPRPHLGYGVVGELDQVEVIDDQMALGSSPGVVTALA
jgi:hypothetical protein